MTQLELLKAIAYIAALLLAGGVLAAPIVAWAKRAADELTVEPDTGEYHD